MEGINALVSAVIAAAVSLAGVIISWIYSRKQIQIKELELRNNQLNFEKESEFKQKELENRQQSMERELEGLRQSQMQSIMQKRLEAYPQLWAIHIRYETNWVFENKKKDLAWARSYVGELNDFNVKHGIFFSQDLYAKFFELRQQLYEGIKNTDTKSSLIPASYTQKIRAIVYGSDGQPGLSTIEKDDLGSYIHVAVQRRI